MFRLRLSRRQFLKALGVSGGTALLNSPNSFPGTAGPGPCPQIAGRMVRWIVPNPPGGGFDTYSRLIAPFFMARIGSKVSVENVPGSGGIVGAYQIAKSDPDGLTLGIVNGPGLLGAALMGDTKVPNPGKDFTILGRVVRSRLVWVTGRNSTLKTMEDVLVESRKRPILFGITEVGSTNFINIAVASHLLNIPGEYVAGYPGGGKYPMPVLRGEVDIMSLTFESGLNRIEAGDIRPLLQTSVERISPHPVLERVALLGGKKGLVARRAEEVGRDVEEAIADAGALIGLVDAGRLIVAPLGLEEGLRRCLEDGLYDALTDPDFARAAAAAKRSLEVARGATARADVLAAMGKAKKLAPIIKKAIKKAR